MWLCTKRGFYSIVQDTADRNSFFIRSRDITHLRALEPGVPIHTTPERDYPYRIHVCRSRLAEIIAMLGSEIDYGNFKSKVDSSFGVFDWYGRALHEVWHVFWKGAAWLRPADDAELPSAAGLFDQE
jgi:hypothetical protein